MQASASTVDPSLPALPLADGEIVRRIREGESALFEVLMRRHNQRVYRTARSVLKDEAEVEDVMQQAYINAFTHLHQFEERAQFSTWLTRIVLNEAFARRQKLQTAGTLINHVEDPAVMETMRSTQATPERQAYADELRRVLEDAVDELPENYRLVFVMRDVEGLSTGETSAGLGLGEEAVKTRLHRARAMLRRSVSSRLGIVAPGAFEFPAVRCDRVVAAVLARIETC